MAVHVRGLDWLNFFLADVQTGVGPFLAIYLAQNHWDPEHVGIALTAGGIVGIVTQTPAGWLAEGLRAKRGLILDGIGAGVFNVVAVLMIADPTRSTGRFNVTQGAIFTAVGIGAALSQTAAGAIVESFVYHAGFLFLAAVAGIAFGIFLAFMPETRPSGGSGHAIAGA